MNRRDLFSFGTKFFKNEEKKPFVVLPPYLKDIHKLTLCETCEEKNCINSCETNIIFGDANGKPFLDFLNGGCTYCDKCLEACDKNVLEDNTIKIKAKLEIEILSCLAWNQTMCFSCKDRCLDNAINFIGLFRPIINQDICTNCGFCYNVCPINAIKIGE